MELEEIFGTNRQSKYLKGRDHLEDQDVDEKNEIVKCLTG
jgi:hypothetical protein